MAEKTLAQYIEDRHADMVTRRSPFETAQQEISDLFMPFRGDVTTAVTPGAKRIASVLDSFGMMAADMLADFVYGNLFTGDWLKLSILGPDRTPDLRLQGVADVTARRILEELDQSNFDIQAFEFLRDMAVLGRAILRIEDDPDEGGLRFTAVPWAQAWIAENKNGEVETVHWEFELPAEEAVDRWKGKAGQKARDLVDKGSGRDRVKFLHAVFKRRKSIPWTMKVKTDEPWASVVLGENSGKGREVVEESGYSIRPYIVGRWMKVAGEEEGRGNGHKARSAMKGTNEITRQVLLAIPITIRPPLFTEQDGLLNTQILPHGIVSVKPGRKFEPRFADVKTNFSAADEIKRMDHETIGRAFLLDALGEKDTEPRSAAETNARRIRALQRLSAPAARVQREFMKPLVLTLIELMEQKKRLPEWQALRNGTPSSQDIPLSIQFLSPLFVAQQENSITTLNITISEALEMFAQTQDPQWVDALHPDRIMAIKRDRRSLPAVAFRTDKELLDLRNARAQQMAQQQMLAAGEQISKMKKNMGEMAA